MPLRGRIADRVVARAHFPPAIIANSGYSVLRADGHHYPEVLLLEETPPRTGCCQLKFPDHPVRIAWGRETWTQLSSRPKDMIAKPARPGSTPWAAALNLVTITYDADGDTTQVQDANTNYQYTYNADDEVSTAADNGTTGLPLVTLTYGYDGDGNETRRGTARAAC